MYNAETQFALVPLKVHHGDGETFIGPENMGKYRILVQEMYQLLLSFREGQTLGEVWQAYGLDEEGHALNDLLQNLVNRGVLTTGQEPANSQAIPCNVETPWITKVSRGC
jgi:hypothetical protein